VQLEAAAAVDQPDLVPAHRVQSGRGAGIGLGGADQTLDPRQDLAGDRGLAGDLDAADPPVGVDRGAHAGDRMQEGRQQAVVDPLGVIQVDVAGAVDPVGRLGGGHRRQRRAGRARRRRRVELGKGWQGDADQQPCQPAFLSPQP